MIPRWLAVTPREGDVDAELVERWLEALAGPSLAVLARMAGDDPNLELEPGGRLCALKERCSARGIAMLCSSAVGADNLAISAVRRFELAGLQLRGDPSEQRIAAARDALPQRLVGASIHGEPRSLGALHYGCIAPIFTPRTPPADGREPKRGMGIPMLRTWAAQTTVPLLALGGVHGGTAEACLAAGAFGIASISTFFGPRAQVVEDLSQLASLDP